MSEHRGIIPRCAPWREVVSREFFGRQGYNCLLSCGHKVYREGGVVRPAPKKVRCEGCAGDILRAESAAAAKEKG
jgi:hypothetical protein